MENKTELQKPKGGMKEFDIMVIVILIGLLAIAIFIWLFFGKPKEPNIIEEAEKNIVVEQIEVLPTESGS